MENIIKTNHLELLKDKTYKSKLNGSVCIPVGAAVANQYSEENSDFSLTEVQGYHNWLYFTNSSNEKRKAKLRPCHEGRSRITAHAFRYFGVCFIGTDGKVLSSSTMWANSSVRQAASSDQTFLGLLMSRNFFSRYPTMRILSMQFVRVGLDVVDPTTHNVSTCNLFCIVG